MAYKQFIKVFPEKELGFSTFPTQMKLFTLPNSDLEFEKSNAWPIYVRPSTFVVEARFVETKLWKICKQSQQMSEIALKARQETPVKTESK